MSKDVERCLALAVDWEVKADQFQRLSDEALARGDTAEARWKGVLARRARTDSERWKKIAEAYQQEALVREDKKQRREREAAARQTYEAQYRQPLSRKERRKAAQKARRHDR